MPVTSTKKLSKKQLIASLVVESDIADGQPMYVIKTPRADAKHTGDPKCICYACQPSRNGGLKMYDLVFTDGITITTDRTLAEKIVSEFPDYKMEELQ